MSSSAPSSPPTSAAWRAPAHGVLAAFCASLVGIGLARFAYTPLVPALIQSGWFNVAAAAYLGAANLAGYLAGALVAPSLGRGLGARMTLRAMMLLAALACLACALPLGFSWFFTWRLLAGVSGGALMVLAATSVLPLVPPTRWGAAAGIIFMGVGAGVLVSATLVPRWLHQGPALAWLGLGLTALLLTALAWGGWPAALPAAARRLKGRRDAPTRSRQRIALYAEYGLSAVAWVPHMLFLVDFVARGLGQGMSAGARHWLAFGLGATLGPLLAGLTADRIGYGRSLRWGFVLQLLALCVAARLGDGLALLGASAVIGAFVTGTVALVLGRLGELLPDPQADRQQAWKTATVVFALVQAIAAYGLSFVFGVSGNDYRLLFQIGAGALFLALLLDLAAGRGHASVSV